MTDFWYLLSNKSHRIDSSTIQIAVVTADIDKQMVFYVQLHFFSRNKMIIPGVNFTFHAHPVGMLYAATITLRIFSNKVVVNSILQRTPNDDRPDVIYLKKKLKFFFWVVGRKKFKFFYTAFVP